MTSTSSQKCKLTVLSMDGKELPLKISVSYFVDAKLHMFFRIAEEFMAGGRDAVLPPPLEITVIADNGGQVVLKEHRTAKESWDAKQNREYLMSARQLDTGDGENGVHQGLLLVKAP